MKNFDALSLLSTTNTMHVNVQHVIMKFEKNLILKRLNQFQEEHS